MKHFVIVNPTSGRGLGEKSIPQIESYLKDNNFDFTLVRTTGVWHAAELAEGAAHAGYDVIVCASGDGTVNEAINGIMRAKKRGTTVLHSLCWELAPATILRAARASPQH
ncbi:MAG: acylglycerol kinase family protein [Anaerolineales bacterium]|nr:acylglycerol kinase family protein [Anaerolineales bacterium]